MLQDKNIFCERFVSSQIHEDGRVFYARMMSCAVLYDVIYHPSPINLNTSGVNSPDRLYLDLNHLELVRSLA